MNIIDRINDLYQQLTKSEKKVADYIVSNQDKVIHNTMSDLSRLLEVGDATIIRLCKKLGLNGFTDLKISIAKMNIGSAHEPFDNSSMLNKIDDSLKRTHQYINEADLEKVVELFKTKKHIYIFGKGQSGMSAMDLEKLLLRNGVQSTALIDSDFQINAAAAMTDEDLLLAFSLTGRTTDLVEALSLAKENGATIIGITNYLLSPIAQLSDIVLQSSYDEFISSPVPGRMSQMYLSGLLVELYEDKYRAEDILTIREKTLRTIIKRRLEE